MIVYNPNSIWGRISKFFADRSLLKQIRKAESLKAFERFEKAEFVSDVENNANIANLCGATYQEIQEAKHKAHFELLVRIQQASSVAEAERLAMVAGALGMEQIVINSSVEAVKRRIAEANPSN